MVQKIFLIPWSTGSTSGTVNHRKKKSEGTSGSLWTNFLLKARQISVREVEHGLASSKFEYLQGWRFHSSWAAFALCTP